MMQQQFKKNLMQFQNLSRDPAEGTAAIQAAALQEEEAAAAAAEAGDKNETFG